MRKVYIASAARTPVTSYGGAFKSVSAVQLGKIVVQEALNRANVSADGVEEVIFGCVLQAGLGQNIARQIAVAAGIPQEVPAMTLNKVCGSGLRAVSLAAQMIKAGDVDLVVAGGVESMSQAPYLLPEMRWGSRMGDVTAVDEMIKDGLWDVFNDVHMGITAENIAEKFGFSRQAQDELATRSQNLASAARANGVFDEEVVPVEVKDRKGNVTVVDKDEFIRDGVTVEGLAKLRPAFKREGGTVTAGNASGINDGAAAIVVMSEEAVERLGVTPLAEIISYASAGVDPAIMGTGPIPATQKALSKAGWEVSDLDLIEANEAFAAQALSVLQGLELNPDIVNVNGGAIAIGHPIGASGARILTTLLYEMKRRDAKKGLATLCIGGGQGTALTVER